jgi:hypothetical protein
VEYVADSALTGVINADKVVCLHGADAFTLTARALNSALDVVGQGKSIVYVACEGDWQLSAILTQIKAARRLTQAPGLFVLPKAVNLLKPGNVDLLAKIIAGKVGHPDLIVLDCLAYCFGADELNPDAMSRFLVGLNRLQEITGAHILLLHRTGRAAVSGSRSTAAPPTGMTLVASAA